MKSKQIKNHPNYLIYEDGRVYNIKTNNFLKGSINNSGYLFFRLRDLSGEYRSLGCHRLLAMVFLPIKEDISKLVVNHKDGNKLNNSLENLEWCTERENFIHASRLGLTGSYISVTVLDLLSGKERVFDSIVDTADALSVSKDEITYYLKFNGDRVYRDDIVILKTSDVKEYLLKIESGFEPTREFGRSLKCMSKNIITHEVVEYEKLTDMAREHGTSVSFMYNILKENRQQVVLDKFQFKLSFIEEWRDIENLEFERLLSKGGRPVAIIGEGIRKTFATGKEASLDIGISTTLFSYRIKTGKIYDGYRYVYLDELIQGPHRQ